jgi:3-carboxy-cis,cis-muconate cycloisomerase
MRENLDRTQGLIFAEAAMMALAPAVGRGVAHHKIEEASHQAIAAKRHLRDVLLADKEIMSTLGREKIEALFDPMNQIGSANAFISRVLDSWRKSRGK